MPPNAAGRADYERAYDEIAPMSANVARALRATSAASFALTFSFLAEQLQYRLALSHRVVHSPILAKLVWADGGLTDEVPRADKPGVFTALIRPRH
jgi:hypothetical protein